MAPKKQMANGFMIFTYDWKAKYGKNLNIRDATVETGKIWAGMTAEERAPYNERAKSEKRNVAKPAPRLTCTGVPVSLVDKERIDQEQKERSAKRAIEVTVRNSLRNSQVESQYYYFIMVNYFTKTLKGGVYVPAEISVAEYSLKDGVNRKYHSFINPGSTIYGHHYEAMHHSDTTHKLPLPPNAKGESDLAIIYNDVLNFVRDKETGEYPPIYTHRDSISIVESVIGFLKTDISAPNIDLKYYPIQYLFYILKDAACEIGEVEKPSSHYITDAFFERDFFEYQTGIACTYHEEIDKSKYCTQSCVTRWGYMFSDYMCRDIAIKLIPGRHLPESVNIKAIQEPPPSTLGDTFDSVSQFSIQTGSSRVTKPLSEYKIYYDHVEKRKPNESASERTQRFSDEFPSLGAKAPRRKAPVNMPSYASQTATSRELQTLSDEDIADINPWSFRTRALPREPESSYFDIDCSNDDAASGVSFQSYGRGRARLNQSSDTISGAPKVGRGTLLRRVD